LEAAPKKEAVAIGFAAASFFENYQVIIFIRND